MILQPALALFLQEIPPLQHLPGFARPGATQTLAAYALPYDEKSEPILLAKYQVLALALGVLAEWQFAPFIRDGSLGYFVTHFYQLKPITLIMIAAGAFIGFWAPFRRRQLDRPS